MKYVSVCSGIEAATVAWHPLGFEAAAFSEIEAFPCAALAHHYPDVDNLGDMEAHANWRLSNVDLLVGGTPCQSFSVAGLRKGMADPRGNLALVYLAIADQLRPEWLVWENVPGVLSSNGGRDFGAFVGGLGELGYRWAYRVLDAQYFGVPQRRRRVFVVGHSGSWQRAAAVLLERSSLRRDSAPSRASGAGVAGALGVGASDGGGWRIGADEAAAGQVVSNALRANSGRNQLEEQYITHTLSAEGSDASEDGTGRGTPLVADPIQANEARTYCNSGNNPRTHNLIAAPLTAGGHPNSNAPGRHKEDDVNLVTVALRSDAGRDGAAKTPSADAEGRVRLRDPGFTVETELAPTLDSTQPHSVQRGATGVRRLTPRECERLQGFPDDYTLIPFRGKLASDTARYRAIGNSMAVPVMRWIGERIMSALR